MRITLTTLLNTVSINMHCDETSDVPKLMENLTSQILDSGKIIIKCCEPLRIKSVKLGTDTQNG